MIIYNLRMQPQIFFKQISDTTRLRILMLLQSEGELCVCELTHALDQSQPKVSRHLALLRDAQMVVARREGIWMHYRIDEALPEWARAVLDESQAGLRETAGMQTDRKRLSTMSQRPGKTACG